MIVINNMEEMEKYYNEVKETYVFKESVEFECDVKTDKSIKAYSIIYASNSNIDVKNIDAIGICVSNIKATGDIYANKINKLNKYRK